MDVFRSYLKINSLYKRDTKGNFTNEFSNSIYEYLYENTWNFLEKINGVNSTP